MLSPSDFFILKSYAQKPVVENSMQNVASKFTRFEPSGLPRPRKC